MNLIELRRLAEARTKGEWRQFQLISILTAAGGDRMQPNIVEDAAFIAAMANHIDALLNVAEALEFYADPDTYFACSFAADQPCGGFADDFSVLEDSGYERPMPGQLAREALAKLESI